MWPEGGEAYSRKEFTLKLEMLINHFIASKALSVSPRTLEWYHYNLGPLADALGQYNAVQVTTEDLEAFLASQAPGRSARTLEGFHTALRALFNWALERGKIFTNPMAPIKGRRARRKIPEIFSNAQIRDLLAAAGNRRDRAILLILLDTGLRRNELLSLDIEDLDLEEGWLKIHGKGDKDRFVPIGDIAGAALGEMLLDHPRTGPLFLNCHGLRLQKGGLRAMLLRLRDQARLSCRVHPHKFRHTFARNYLQRGDLESLRDILGHEDIRITAEIYGSFTRARLKEQHRRCSPVDHANWEQLELWEGDT
jgi:site-specific recombinase XerD